MMVLLLIMLLLAAYVEVNRRGIPVCFFYFLFFIISVLEGMRWYSGCDFYMYYNSYQQLLNPITELQNKRYDKFYLWLTFLFKSFNINYTLFLLFLSSVTSFLYAITIKKLTGFPVLALLVLFVSLIGLLGSSRELISLAIVFFGIQFVIEKKYGLYIFIVLLAVGFHFTAIIMLPIVFFRNEISLKKWVLIMVGILLVSFLPLDDFLLSFFNHNQRFFPFLTERFSAYIMFNDKNIGVLQIILGVVRKSLPIFIAVFYKDKLEEKAGYYLFLNISFLSLALYIWASLNFTFFLGRLTIYYSIFDCIIYSWIGYVFIKQKKDQILLLLFLLFCIFLFIKGISLYPELFIPYKTRFFTL